jgi:hypothetical protein
MQPAYLPWPGYFNLIHESDVFVFLDDVQFEKQSWQSRNRVLVGGSERWLSVPVKKAPLETLLKDVLVSEDKRWRWKHAETLKHCYKRHPFYRDIRDVIGIVEMDNSPNLTSLTTAIIRQLCAQLEISRRFENSSSLGIPGARSERLLSFCRHLGCDEYLSPAGAARYLAADGVFDHTEVAVRDQAFAPRRYPQKGSMQFVPYLSVLDALANLGVERTREYIAAVDGEFKVA